MKYSKTVYIEVDADDEETAVEVIDVALSPILHDPTNEISFIDLDGPIEEAAE